MDNDISILAKLNSLPKNIIHILFSKVSNKLFVFSKDTYWRYDKLTFNVDPGYPKLISNGWKGVPDSFNCCGYIKNNSLQQLIFIKDNYYWLYDEVSNKLIVNGKLITDLGLDETNKVSSILVSYYQQQEYNMFITEDDVILINPTDKTKQSLKFKIVFPGIPIYSAGFYVSNNYIGFRFNQSYTLFDSINTKSIETNQVNEAPFNSDKIRNNMDRVQQWCLHLYNQNIYDDIDYNTCIENSGYIGNNLVANKTELANNKSYEYSLNNSDNISIDINKPLSFNQVYLKTHGDYYLTNRNDGIYTINTLNADESQIWNIEIIDEKQFAIKNKNGNYLEINKNESVILGTNVINPLNKWKLIEYLNSYNIVNSYSGKSLKANNLGIDVFNPNENMIWDIIPANKYEKFDSKEIDDRYNVIINKLRETYADYVKLGYAVNLEKTYQTNAINCFEQLKTLCKSKIINTAIKYYYPVPMSVADKKDPQKVIKYNYDNAWRFLINEQSVGEYKNLYNTALSNVTKYCDSISKFIDEQKEIFINNRRNVNLAKLNALYKNKTDLYNEQYDNLNIFISDLNTMVDESTNKLESYRLKLEQSLSEVEDTQNNYSKIAKSIGTLEQTNTENLKILNVLNDNEKYETNILYIVMIAMFAMFIVLGMRVNN